MTRPILTIALTTAALLAGASQAAQAQVTAEEIEQRVLASRALSSTDQFSATRREEQILLEIRLSRSMAEPELRSVAFQVATMIIHADPGYTRSVLARFTLPLEDYSSSRLDVLVTNKDVVGVDAGITSKQSTLRNLTIVRLGASDSPSVRYGKYLSAGRQLLSSGRVFEADHLLEQAAREAPGIANNNPQYLDLLKKLADAFDSRANLDEAERIYKKLAQRVKANPSSVSATTLRQVARYFVKRGDYANAQGLAAILVDRQRKTTLSRRKRFASDLRMLALCYRNQGQTNEAKKLLEEGLLYARNTQGEHHPDVAALFEDLGDCYATDGNTSQAFTFYDQAKKRYDKSMGSKNKGNRVEYEIYRGAISRLKTKMRKIGKTG